MDSFKLMSKVLTESKGEFPAIDTFMLKTPSFGNKFRSWILGIFKAKKVDKAKYLKSESMMVASKFKNIKINIYALPEKDMNCLTIPGYFGDVDDIGLYAPAKHPDLDKQYLALKQMNFDKVKAGSNGTVIFPPNKLEAISIFVSFGTLAVADKEERLAIYLHEIGHWAYLSRMIPRQILFNRGEMSDSYTDETGIRVEFYNIRLLHHVLKLGFERWNEYEADLYAVKSGYGNQLKSFFDKIEMGPSKNAVDAYTYVDNQQESRLIKIWNISKSRLNIGGYPNYQHRKDQINHAMKDKKYMK